HQDRRRRDAGELHVQTPRRRADLVERERREGVALDAAGALPDGHADTDAGPDHAATADRRAADADADGRPRTRNDGRVLDGLRAHGRTIRPDDPDVLQAAVIRVDLDPQPIGEHLVGGGDLHPYRAAGNAAAALGLGAGGPVIAGHEPCGVAAAVGAGVDPALVGQRVMNHHYKGCGACRHCRLGWSQLCRAGITVYGMTGHGGHARYMKAPAFTCVPLPEELSFEEGASVSCGTGTAYGALKRIDVSG